MRTINEILYRPARVVAGASLLFGFGLSTAPATAFSSASAQTVAVNFDTLKSAATDEATR